MATAMPTATKPAEHQVENPRTLPPRWPIRISSCEQQRLYDLNRRGVDAKLGQHAYR